MQFDAQPRFSARTASRSSSRPIGTAATTSGPWTSRRKRRKQITKGKSNRYRSPDVDARRQLHRRRAGAERRSARRSCGCIHKDGGAGTQLIRDPQPMLAGALPVSTLGAAFGKDDRYIWFAQRSGAWEYNAGLPQYQHHDVRPAHRPPRDARQHVRLGVPPRAVARRKVSRLRLALRDADRLRIRDLETSEERWLAYPVQRDEQESSSRRSTCYPGYSFTPDSKAIVVSYGGKIWRVPVRRFGAADQHSVPRRRPRFDRSGPKLAFNYPIDDARGVHRQADSRRRAVAGRQAARVRRARPAVRDGLSDRHAAPPDRPRRATRREPRGRPTASGSRS